MAQSSLSGPLHEPSLRHQLRLDHCISFISSLVAPPPQRDAVVDVVRLHLSQFPPALVDHSVRLNCPHDRSAVMLRHRFSTAVPFEIDECPQCGGV